MNGMGIPNNLHRRLKWKGGWMPTITLSFLILTLLYLMPRSAMRIKHQRPIVVLRQGKIIGVEIEKSEGYPQVLEAFRGVPYAQSTAGDRRFLPPLPVNESIAEFDASVFGAQCTVSEDCLNANIYRPKHRGGNHGKKLPVVIHFHGGAFNFGAGDSSQQLASFVAWSEEPMIAVGFNYRVGAFGFLASGFMKEEGLLNVGLKDQVALMEWVRENIEAFGGDEENVTIMGSSAGAHSIGHHLIHQYNKPPLFHRAILESGAATARAVYSYSNPLHENQFQDFLKILNLASIPQKTLLSALRKVPTSEFRRASETIFNKYNPSIRWPFQPVLDGPGGLIPIAPIKSLKAGKFVKIPILTGFNTNEGAMFVPKNLNTGKEFTAFFKELLPGLRGLDLERLNEIYPDPDFDEKSRYRENREGVGKQFKRVEAAYGQFAYVAPVRHTVYFTSQISSISTKEKEEKNSWKAPPQVYLYHFAANSTVIGGADHGSHIPWVNYLPERRDKGEVINEISGSMHAYWSSFITRGDPNVVKEGKWGKRVDWPVYKLKGDEEGTGYGSSKGKIMVFGEGNDVLAGGRGEGVAVRVKDDGFAVEESGFWWARTELFEF